MFFVVFNDKDLAGFITISVIYDDKSKEDLVHDYIDEKIEDEIIQKAEKEIFTS